MPRIVTARALGLTFRNLFGELGPETSVVGHHTAGPKDRDRRHAADLIRTYHRQHAAQGYGGLGYHYMIARDGTILCGRPTYLKGAHVAAQNSGRIGVVFCGTTGDKPTRAQARSYRWLLAHAHTSALPRAHRTDRDLRRVPVLGHKDVPGQSTACPGTHHRMIRSRGRRR